MERFERAVEVPLLVLAVAMVPLLVVPLVVELPKGMEAAAVALDWLIWAAFALEYGVRLWLADRRLRFVVRAWPDLLIVALPLLRPLRLVRSARVLRLLRLVRLAAVLAAVFGGVRRVLARHGLHYALATAGVLVVGAASVMVVVERDAGGSITSFGDALWWAATTVTTVGYGDTFPVTPAGRGIAVFLMLVGITLFGVLTVLARLAAIERRLGE